MEYHDIANIFPLLTGAEFDALRDDIAKNGLHEPIVIYEGKILDGRNRYAACLDADIAPEYEDYIGNDAIGYVVSKNLYRRHLTPGQRAFAALEAEKLYAKEAKKRQGQRTDIVENIPPSDQGKARDKAAKDFDVNPHYITDAKQMDKSAPDLAKQVRSGEKTMSRAKIEMGQRKKREDIRTYSSQVISNQILEKKYNVIYADPPWQYATGGGANTLPGTTDKHYSTMTTEDVCLYIKKKEIRIQENAVLFLWVTNPFLEIALGVVNAWGFNYKTNIVWRKTELKKLGVGYYVRGQHELLYICTRGSFTPLDKNISPPISSVIELPIREHSKKPEEVYGIIERLYPDCIYIELFARNRREGWDSLGAESE